MFKSIRLRNFKGYKDSGEIPLAPLTIIIGPNNSGKSTILQALLALAQTARDTDQGWGPRLVTKGLVDLNGYHDIVHGKGQANSSFFGISVGLEGSTARPRTLADGANTIAKFRVPDQVEISFKLDEELEEIAVMRSTLRISEKTNISVEKKHGSWSLNTPPPGSPDGMEVDFVNVFPCVSIPAARFDHPSPEDIAAARISEFCASVWAEVFSKKVHHIGPLRRRVPWHASVGSRTSSKFGAGGENLIADLGSKEKDADTEKTRLELVNEWLAKRRLLRRVHLQSDQTGNGRRLLGDEWTGPKDINIAGMGEGVSQILPIIAASRFRANEDCLLVEQPEIHLHPALQAELGDLFIEATKTGHRQILVETHSEHLLLRVRRRIAEGTLDLDQVNVLFVEKPRAESKVQRLDLNNRGHFTNWPDGFFDDAYQEAMALATAAAKRPAAAAAVPKNGR